MNGGKEKKDADGTQQNSWPCPRAGDTGPSLSYTKSMSRRENELSTPWKLLLQTPLKADRRIYSQAHLPMLYSCDHSETVKYYTVTKNFTQQLTSAYHNGVIIPCQQVGGTFKPLFPALHLYTAFISSLLAEFDLILARKVVPMCSQWRHRDPSPAQDC